MSRPIVLLAFIALAGCVTTSGVTPMGRDTFMVSTDARGGFTSSAELTAKKTKKTALSRINSPFASASVALL